MSMVSSTLFAETTGVGSPAARENPPYWRGSHHPVSGNRSNDPLTLCRCMVPSRPRNPAPAKATASGLHKFSHQTNHSMGGAAGGET
jgi:hypothetical protein